MTSIILILVAIAVIGGLDYLKYHSQKKNPPVVPDDSVLGTVIRLFHLF